MPVYRVQTPDGTVVRVEGPENATEEQLINAVKSMAPAKDAAAPAPAAAPATPAAPTFDQKLRASGIMRAVQGMRDPIDAGAQMLPKALGWVASAGGLAPNRVSDFLQSEGQRVDAGIKDAEQKLAEARKATGQEGLDGMRLLGNVLSPANAAVAARVPMAASMTVPQLAGRGVIAGAAGGLLTPVANMDEGQSFLGTKAAQAGLGAVTGGLLTPPLAKGAEAAGRYAQRVLVNPEVQGARASLMMDEAVSKALQELGQDPATMRAVDMQQLRQQVVESMKQGKQIDPAALLRKQDFEKVGVTPTLGQITRDPTQFARERNLRGVEGVGEPLQNRFTVQNQQIANIVNRMGGPQAAPTYQAGERISGALRGLDEQMAAQVRGAYGTAREATGRDASVPLTGLAQDYANILRDFGEANIPGAIRSRLNETGMMSGKQTALFTQNDAEQLLQSINKNYDPMRKAEAAALDALRGAVKKAVVSGDDAGGVFAPARELAAKRFKIQEAVPALQAAADGSVPADDFVRRFVINGKTAEVKNLAKMLQNADPDAYNEARNQVGAQLARAAFGENLSGDKLFSPERFAKTLREFGPDKLQAFFSAEEVDQLQRLARVGAYINIPPSAAAVNYSNTAGAMMNLLSKVPGVPLAAQVLTNAKRTLDQRNIVNSGLAAQIPTTPAELPPEVNRLLLPGLLGSAYGGGAAAGTTFR